MPLTFSTALEPLLCSSLLLAVSFVCSLFVSSFILLISLSLSLSLFFLSLPMLIVFRMAMFVCCFIFSLLLLFLPLRLFFSFHLSSPFPFSSDYFSLFVLSSTFAAPSILSLFLLTVSSFLLFYSLSVFASSSLLYFPIFAAPILLYFLYIWFFFLSFSPSSLVSISLHCFFISISSISV